MCRFARLGFAYFSILSVKTKTIAIASQKIGGTGKLASLRVVRNVSDTASSCLKAWDAQMPAYLCHLNCKCCKLSIE